jgi:hypothetical protein
VTRPGRLTGYPIYPVLLAVAVIVEPMAGYNVEPQSGLRVLAIAIAIAIAVTVAAVLWLGRDHGGVAAAIVVMGLMAATEPARVLLVIAAVGLVTLEWWLGRRERLQVRLPWPRVTEALNVFLIVLVGLQVGRGVALRVEASPIRSAPGWTVSGPVDGPDVFVLLADGHGRSDVLARDFGLDMTAFRASLDSLGFTEAARSEANHVHTRYSLSVLFNGRPLSELGQDLDQPIDEAIPVAALRHSSAAQLLDSAGYEFVVIPSGYEHLALRGNGRYIDVGPRNEVEQAMLDTTAIGRAIDGLTAGADEAAFERTQRELDAMADLAERPSDHPLFVFTHIPAPHFPMVFNADCTFRPVDSYTPGSIVTGYSAGDATAVAVQRDQTACVDRLAVATLKRVVAARPDAIVILLSDHGPAEILDWNAPAEPGLGDRFANLFWARTPGETSVFPDDVTLVNVLPILYNTYLGTQLPLHPNDLWFGPTIGVDTFSRYVPPVS